MASRIQGITVEIGGDTTKLTTAFSSMWTGIKNTVNGIVNIQKFPIEYTHFFMK